SMADCGGGFDSTVAGPKPHRFTSGPTVTSKAPPLKRLTPCAVSTASQVPAETANQPVDLLRLNREISESTRYVDIAVSTSASRASTSCCSWSRSGSSRGCAIVTLYRVPMVPPVSTQEEGSPQDATRNATMSKRYGCMGGSAGAWLKPL